MSKYVKADMIVDRVCEGISCNECSFGTNEDGMSECVLDKRIAELPTADVVEVVHGEWFPNRFKTLREDGWCECSVCGFGNKLYDRGVRKSDIPYIDGKPYELKNIANYCPNCGADMRGENNELHKRL